MTLGRGEIHDAIGSASAIAAVVGA